MIKNEIVAKRYADAFLGYCAETIGYEKGLGELSGARRVFEDNPDFREFMESLEITTKEKFDIIEKVLGKNFSEELRNFLKLLLEKGRIRLLLDIAEYARINYSHGVEQDALLKTSYPLETEVIERLKNVLESKLEKKLHLYVELDPGLLGGVSVEVGNMIIDGSVKKRLEDLRQKLILSKVEHHGN
ncbi:MAG: ATP synthase F1 subunit delta [Candidatus Omnitrophica bacterium]|nr:ATP synthase F1 subunit delta [Candidatus Omnitrophota bacterium]